MDAMDAMKATLLLLTTVGLLSSSVGCGGPPPPDEGMRRATAAARTASELGAEREPQAQVHLKRANDQINEAQSLMKDGKNKRAETVLEVAEAEAELAVMLAKENTSRAGATEAQDKVKSLKGGK
jgi:hypothetical protein